MRHVIRKQVIHLKTANASEAYRLQHDAQQYYYKEVLPVLEKLFNQLCGDDRVLLLDRLEIDLGQLVHKETRQLVSRENIEKIIREQLQDKIATVIRGDSYSTAQKRSASRSATPALHALDQWMYYMQHGVLPWNVQQTDDAWRIHVLEALATDYQGIALLSENIQRHPALLKRIVNEHKDDFLEKLVEVITAVKQPGLHLLAGQIANIIPGVAVALVKQIIWQAIIMAAVKTGGHHSEALIRSAWVSIRASKPVDNIPQRQIVQLLKKETALNKILSPIIKEETVHKDAQLKPGDPETTSKKTTPPATGKETGEQPAAKNTQPVDEHTAQIKKTGATDDAGTEAPFNTTNNEALQDGVFVQHAGLILLHPFYRFLFRNTQLMEDGAFVNRTAQEKAIYLLHYIATGEETAEEYLLTVPKIICGWPVEEPVTPVEHLGASLTGEADDLIKAAIAQWAILKSTSIEGMRETFLQRNGKVMNTPNGLLLQVEPGPVDMLLDHLPWNLSIVKLPWLEELIRVEWR